MSEDAFYDRLSPYGYWRNTGEYGRVWVPAGVGAEFQPYSDGHWALTDWGWTYVSDAPWGWAAYHYGRWGYGLGLGWYWIPGRTWGPLGSAGATAAATLPGPLSVPAATTTARTRAPGWQCRSDTSRSRSAPSPCPRSAASASSRPRLRRPGTRVLNA